MNRTNISKKIQKYTDKAIKEFFKQTWDKAYPFFKEDKINETKHHSRTTK